MYSKSSVKRIPKHLEAEESLESWPMKEWVSIVARVGPQPEMRPDPSLYAKHDLNSAAILVISCTCANPYVSFSEDPPSQRSISTN